MNSPEYLLHSENITGIPLVGERIASGLDQLAGQVETESGSSVTVAIRTLNEAEELEGLLEDLDAQSFGGEVETIVIDNESSDATREVAHHYGVAVVVLARDDFTYPASMNLSMQAASHDTVFMTVGHARLSNTQVLRAGARHFDDENVAGTFGRTLPNANASRTERLLSVGNLAFLKSQRIEKAGLGVLGATNAMISKAVWDELGRFDERYERGGEDTLLARQMLEAGYSIVEDPVMAVHHTHGLGPINTIRQWRQWMTTLKGPQELDRYKLAARRPDLDLAIELTD